MMSIEAAIALAPHAVSCVISALIAWLCWSRGEVNGAREYAAAAGCQALWSAGLICELLSPTLAGKVAWDNAQWVVTFSLVAAFLAFALRYTDRDLPRPRITVPLIALPSLVAIVLIYTDPLHGLARNQVRLVPGVPFDALIYGFAPTLIVLWLWSYLLYFWAVGLLLRGVGLSNPLLRAQISLVLVGSLVPVIGSVLSWTVLAQSTNRDVSSYSFSISSVLIAFALLRFRLFNIVPIARDAVVEQMADAVFVLDANRRVVDANPAAQTLITQLLGVAIDMAQVPDHWQQLLAGYVPSDDAAREVALSTPRGNCHLELRAQPVRSRLRVRRGYAVIVRDITERKAAEAELHSYRQNLEALVTSRTIALQAANDTLRQEIERREQLEDQIVAGQKLEALGRMAGGIAHDFNNALAVILAASELLLAECGLDDPARADLTAIAQAARHSVGMTRQLLAFSRRQSLQLVALDLCAVVVELEGMLHRLAGPDVGLRLDLHPGETLVFADQVQLQQVIINLVINARDAMPEGGEIWIGVARVRVAEVGAWRLDPGVSDAYVRLTVRDSGVGMDAATRQQLFEPFFTTKGEGRGTGLGLAVVHGIVKQLGGEIAVESEPGRGTSFAIGLPPLAASPLWREHDGSNRRSGT